MQLITKIPTDPLVPGHYLGVFFRYDDATPYIVCAIDPSGEPMLEAVFDAYAEMHDPEVVLAHTYNRVATVALS